MEIHGTKKESTSWLLSGMQSQIKFACSIPGLIAENSFLAHDLAPCFEWLDLGFGIWV
jgi:hypothetical protein